jgi:hypothetical protein
MNAYDHVLAVQKQLESKDREPYALAHPLAILAGIHPSGKSGFECIGGTTYNRAGEVSMQASGGIRSVIDQFGLPYTPYAHTSGYLIPAHTDTGLPAVVVYRFDLPHSACITRGGITTSDSSVPVFAEQTDLITRAIDRFARTPLTEGEVDIFLKGLVAAVVFYSPRHNNVQARSDLAKRIHAALTKEGWPVIAVPHYDN